ncbi:Fc.00g105850.m01.CDS01 [Cosmosporella sp. VM-42]
MAIINHRLDDPVIGLTDGVLGAVFLLTFGMRLSNDEKAMDIHLEGLSQMVAYRRAQSNHSIPSWFTNLLLYDSIHQIVASTGSRHEKVIRALRDENIRRINEITKVARGVSELCLTLQDCQDHPMKSSRIKDEIEELLTKLHCDTQALFQDEDPFVRSLMRAIKGFLFLSWPSEPEVDLRKLALDLRETMLQRQITLCGSHELTVWQYFIGGLAAESDPQTMNWFLMRLKEMLLAMRITRWQEVSAILKKGFFPDAPLLARFIELWKKANL